MRTGANQRIERQNLTIAFLPDRDSPSRTHGQRFQAVALFVSSAAQKGGYAVRVSEKNDFANWARYVLGEMELARARASPRC